MYLEQMIVGDGDLSRLDDGRHARLLGFEWFPNLTQGVSRLRSNALITFVPCFRRSLETIFPNPNGFSFGA